MRNCLTPIHPSILLPTEIRFLQNTSPIRRVAFTEEWTARMSGMRCIVINDTAHGTYTASQTQTLCVCVNVTNVLLGKHKQKTNLLGGGWAHELSQSDINTDPGIHTNLSPTLALCILNSAHSLDVRGVSLTKGIHWSSPDIFGPRARFNIDADVPALEIEVRRVWNLAS